MKIILAFDSFKNCLSSPEICKLLAAEFKQRRPEWEILPMPLGDGGEGTARAVTAALGGRLEKCIVHDPLHRRVEAEWGALPDGGAVLEMASASGIELLTRSELDPWRTSTFGTGELLRELACRKGIRRFTIGIGGSATVDGGAGMLQALGVRFFDRAGQALAVPAGGGALSRIARVDISGLAPEIRASAIRIASDVTNPLCGPEGAAQVFAPQKGADGAMVAELEKNLRHWGETVVAEGIADDFEHPGDGAAGGMGFALRAFLQAAGMSGAELVLEVLKFDEALAGADWVLTGEGCSDFQTAHGKLCSVVASHARRRGIPVILLSGALGERAEELENIFDAVLALAAHPGTLEDALQNTPRNLKRMGGALANLLTGRRQ